MAFAGDDEWDAVFDGAGLALNENAAGSVEIEDLDRGQPMELETDPFLPGVIDQYPQIPGVVPYMANEWAKAAREEDDPRFADQPDDAEHLDDDFQAILRRRDESVIGHDGRPVSELLSLAHAAEQQHLEDSARSPYVNVAPESAHRALLGGNATVQPGQQPVQVVFWQGEDVETKSCSIVFAPVPNSGQPAARAFCRILFGCRAGLASVDIDVGAGGMVTLPTSSLVVSVGLDDSETAPFSMMASVSFDPIMRTAKLQRSFYLIFNNLELATQVVTRPPFAIDVTFFRSSGAAFDLNFRDRSGTTIYSQQIPQSNTYAPLLTVPLANDVVDVEIVAGAGSSSQDDHARAVFGLCV